MKQVFLFIGFLLSWLIQAQVTTSISRDSILFGEPINLTIQVPFDERKSITFPSLKDTLMLNVEILSNQIDTIETKGKFLKNTIQFTSFEPGGYFIKTLPVVIDGDTIRTKSYQIQVLDIAIDETQDKVYPIKPILEEKLTIRDYLQKYWVYILVIGIILFIFMIILILFLVNRKKKKKQIIPKTPYEEAIFRLKELDKKKYLENENVKPYYSDLVFILKNYFEKRFNFPALKFLSDELVTYIEDNKELNEESCNKMHRFFLDADGVKFAKAIPEKFKHKEYRRLVEEWIEQTKPIEVDEENEVFNQRKSQI